jgi:hypothetical protein
MFSFIHSDGFDPCEQVDSVKRELKSRMDKQQHQLEMVLKGLMEKNLNDQMETRRILKNQMEQILKEQTDALKDQMEKNMKIILEVHSQNTKAVH